ncbi:hypothetical protein FA95DRAFT_1614259 [Auriscalpium vulgare]|uniref:Uncharacterized protein n=1 Tax=Auriscalpium vulgare TaxID=40419 RepID=A0ACB8R0G3_9AGAM|nr:hypothetical protein FA95DRAFT_1614259 [Auriscalpium vulgare]
MAQQRELLLAIECAPERKLQGGRAGGRVRDFDYLDYHDDLHEHTSALGAHILVIYYVPPFLNIACVRGSEGGAAPRCKVNGLPDVVQASVCL